jgi:hypothetical protein
MDLHVPHIFPPYMFSTFKFLLNRWMNNDTDTVSTCACKKIPEFVAVVRLRSGSYREKRKKTVTCVIFSEVDDAENFWQISSVIFFLELQL